MPDVPNPDGLIASRLDHLFQTVHPAGRGPYTPGGRQSVAPALLRRLCFLAGDTGTRRDP
jgi:hypothetical protein